MREQTYDTQLTAFLRRLAIWLGLALLVISAYLSYDGFDGTVSGTNNYSKVAGKVIGIVFAITVSALQFIFSTDIRGLNKTLKFSGLLSYAYSIYTNKLGAQNLLGMDENMSWATALIADLVAEPLIAWGLGEALIGGFLDNITQMIKTQLTQLTQPTQPKQTQWGAKYDTSSETMKNIPRYSAEQSRFIDFEGKNKEWRRK